jgi:hypoxanthine phosphoribosyltransferase
MAANVEYEVPTWNQIYATLIKQTERICNNFKPDVIVGICRGGWIPARVLSDLLDNSNLASVRTESYTGIGRAADQPILTQEVSMDVKGKKVLLVDEIVDSGQSLKLIIDHINQQGASEVKTATLYYKPSSVIKPDYCEKETSKWVIFPWETKEALKEICKIHKDNAEQLKKQIQKIAAAGMSKSIINQFLKSQSEVTKC